MRLPRSCRLALATLIALVLMSGCSRTDSPVVGAGPTSATAGAPAVARATAGASRPPAAPSAAPTKTFAVGVRKITVVRDGRRLPTTIWYPANGAKVAAGRFPIVLFSHGLRGLPDYYRAVTTRWAAAGFIVAAPTYPKTNANADPFDVLDVGQQPLDAAAVISKVRSLDAAGGDAFAGHVDTGRVAAAGHSAGGFTTIGMLSSPNRDEQVDAAIVIAGASLGGQFTGPSAPVLFVHGSADPTVSIDGARTAYGKLSWPKGFLTLTGQGHNEYLSPGARGFTQVVSTTTDFLRATLYGDTAARRRLSSDARASGVSTYASSHL
jgi:dienelactone hydrolase